MRGRVLATLLSATWAVQPNVAVPKDPYFVTTLCTPYPANVARRVSVSNGAELQKALDAAVAGDVISLTAGTVFSPPSGGSFVLRNRSIPANEWVILRSASGAFDPGGTVPPNTRVDKSKIAEMPQIRSTSNNAPAFISDSGARGYRLVGLDVGADPSIIQLTNLIDFELGASDIVIDRCYLHGNDSGNFRRGVVVNGARLAVIESYLENFHDANSDSQAIGGWQGPGPFKIVNNFLEAASENILFGGSDPTTANLVPADIEIRRNLSTKRLSWKAAGVPVKNAFELKNARRVLIDGNVFENVWASGQDGTAILLKSDNQDGACPWCVTEYVIFRNNIVRTADNGLSINGVETGRPGLLTPVHANHIRFENVLFEGIGGKLFRVFNGVTDLTLTHITSRSNPAGILDPAGPTDVNPRLVFTYNIVERKLYGIGYGGDEGQTLLSRNFPSFSYSQNVIVNTSAGTDQATGDSQLEGRYPAQTWVVSGWDAVGFTSGSSKLTTASRFRKAGSDGKDIGADVDAIDAAAQNGPGGSAACTASTRTQPASVVRRGR